MPEDEIIEHQDEVEAQAISPDELVADMQQSVDGEKHEEQPEQEEKLVPLSALQRERKKRQEAELHSEWHLQERQRMMQQQVAPKEEEEDETLYESATKGELRKSKQETIDAAVREVKEQLWVDNNPEKTEYVNQKLTNFLKQNQDYAYVLKKAPNRYQEAYRLMTALEPEEPTQQKTRTETKKDAPNAPTSVPKSTAMNANIDLMKMSDKEYQDWRASKRKRR